MANSKPVTAFILSLIGGIIVLIFGLGVMIIGERINLAFVLSLVPIIRVLGLFGVVCGILMIVGAVMLNSRPQQHTIWGAIVMVFSILSWFGAVGGMFVGFILGLIGGILGIAWKPPAVQTTPLDFAPKFSRICPNCRSYIGTDIKFCPHCGKELPK